MVRTEDLEADLKELIVKTLELEDVTAPEIDSEAALFGEGLGLDSIDALELGVALHKTYGLKIEAASEEVRQHFRSVRALANYISSQLEKNA